MEGLKKIEEILSNWKEQAKANTVFEKDATIDYDKRTVHLTIVSSNSRIGVFTDCEAIDKIVLKAIDLLEEAKEKIQ